MTKKLLKRWNSLGEKHNLCHVKSAITQFNHWPVKGDNSRINLISPRGHGDKHTQIDLRCSALWVWSRLCIWLTQPAECRMQNKCGRIWSGARFRMRARHTPNPLLLIALSEPCQMYTDELYKRLLLLSGLPYLTWHWMITVWHFRGAAFLLLLF